MSLILAPFSPFLFLNAVLLLAFGLFIRDKRSIRGAAYFSNLILVGAFWSICDYQEAIAPALNEKIVTNQLSYLGIVFIGYFWLSFSLEYAQYTEKIKRIVQYTVAIPAIIGLAVVLTNQLHGYIWSEIYQTTNAAGQVLVIYNKSIGFYLNVGIIYAELLIGIAILLHFAITNGKKVFQKVILAIAAIIVPAVVSVVHLVAFQQFGGYDPTPFAIFITALIISVTLYRRNSFALIPTAKETVYQSLDSGIIIVDKNSVVIDMNETARRMLRGDIKLGTDLCLMKGTSDKELDHLVEILTGRINDLTFYCERVEKWIEVRKYPLMQSGKKAEDFLYFFYDITKQKEIFEQLKESESLLSSIISFLPDPTFVIDKEGKVVIWNKAMEVMSQVTANKMIGKGDYAYALPLYGKKRPMLVDVALNPMADYADMYKAITRQADTISAVISKDELSLWCIAKPLYDNEGNILGAIESIRNISEQKKTEAELQDRLDTLLKLNDIMVKRESRIADLSEELKKQKKLNEKD
jgi:PAS domain-containing protein